MFYSLSSLNLIYLSMYLSVSLSLAVSLSVCVSLFVCFSLSLSLCLGRLFGGRATGRALDKGFLQREGRVEDNLSGPQWVVKQSC